MGYQSRVIGLCVSALLFLPHPCAAAPADSLLTEVKFAQLRPGQQTAPGKRRDPGSSHQPNTSGKSDKFAGERGEKRRKASSKKPEKKSAGKGNGGPVGASQALVLIRGALLTLNDALHTGNYTVLRDRASPSFRNNNQADRLGMIFQNLKRQKVDLSAVAVLTPVMTSVPAIDGSKRLNLSGRFPGKPVSVVFNLAFEDVGGHWRLFGISVNLPKHK